MTAVAPAKEVEPPEEEGAGEVTYTVNITEDNAPTMTIAAIVEAFREGTVDGETLIWTEALEDWTTVARVPEVVAALTAAGLEVAAAQEGESDDEKCAAALDAWITDPLAEGSASHFVWLSDAANRKHLGSLRALGFLHQLGLGVEQSSLEARGFYQTAADLGDAPSQRQIGLFFELGEDVDADPKKAAEWYRKAADQSDATAQWLLGLCYAQGKGVERDVAQAIDWYGKAARQGDAVALRELGVCYSYGDGLALDPKEAVACFRQAARADDAEAQYLLAMALFEGRGVKKDTAGAVSWLEKAAELGHGGAQYRLGLLLQKGMGVKKDLAKAREQLEAAAAQDLAVAHRALGDLSAEAATPDWADAVTHYEAAAEGGDAPSKRALGSCYAAGNGVARDEAKARALWEEAATLGDRKAKELLAPASA